MSYQKNLTILGIESSCDETAAAVYTTQEGIKASLLFSQIEIQKKWGGVVPELAASAHLEKMLPIIDQTLTAAQTPLEAIDAIAVTNKPGLPGPLLIGLCSAKALAWTTNKPIIGVNHLEGHAFSSCIENNVPFPHLCITASGGHTSLYLVHDFGKYEILGQTVDDAAGEAFDKISKFIGLGYPGGPVIEKMAQEAQFKDFFNYPRGKGKDLNFSFSGLKTAVLYNLVEQGAFTMTDKKLLNDSPELKQQVASSLLVCIKDIFRQRLEEAFKRYPAVKAATFVGGVACNKYIRAELLDLCTQYGKEFYVPSPKYCTDNAAMIAFVGHYKAQRGEFDTLNLDIFT